MNLTPLASIGEFQFGQPVDAVKLALGPLARSTRIDSPFQLDLVESEDRTIRCSVTSSTGLFAVAIGASRKPVHLFGKDVFSVDIARLLNDLKAPYVRKYGRFDNLDITAPSLGLVFSWDGPSDELGAIHVYSKEGMEIAETFRDYD